LKKRIREIKTIQNKNNKDYYVGRNKFMKAYFHNNPARSLNEINNKYINNCENPIPIKIKSNNSKQLINTKISPIRSYDWVTSYNSLENNIDKNINKEKASSKNFFITNNKEFTLHFNTNRNNSIINNRYYNETNNSKERRLLLFSPMYRSNKNLRIKFSQLKLSNLKKYRTLSVVKNEKKKSSKLVKPKKFDFNEIFANLEISKFLSYFSFASLSPKKKNINQNNKNSTLEKYINYFNSSPKKQFLNFSPKSNKYFSPINKEMRSINIYRNKLKSDKSIKEDKEEKEKILKFLSDKNMNIKITKKTTIDFNGYRVFLPKQGKKIYKRYNSHREKDIIHSDNKNKKINQKEYHNIIKEDINNIKKTIKRNISINYNNLYKVIKIKSEND
jgi:hypothetical protein